MNKKLRATSVPELLVTLIIMGIVFIAVTDGLVLFRRFASAFGEKTGYNIDTLNQYYREHVYDMPGDTLTVCDTLCGEVEHPVILKLKQEEEIYFQSGTDKKPQNENSGS